MCLMGCGLSKKEEEKRLSRVARAEGESGCSGCYPNCKKSKRDGDNEGVLMCALENGKSGKMGA